MSYGLHRTDRAWSQQEDETDNGDTNELIDDRPEDAHLEAEYEDRLSPWEADINPYDGGLTTDDPDFVRDSDFDDDAPY